MRFVTSDTVVLHLKPQDGVDQWIEVKKELGVGEERTYRSAGFTNVTPAQSADTKKGAGEAKETSIAIDWKRQALARVETYLVDWSATVPSDPKDPKSKPRKIEVSRAAIENLEPADFDEIDAAIQAHIASQDAEKKARAGVLTPALP